MIFFFFFYLKCFMQIQVAWARKLEQRQANWADF